MNNKIFRILFYLTLINILIYSCKKNEDTTTTTPNNSTTMTARDSAAQDYNTNFIGSAISDPGWTGNTATCSPGTVSQSSEAAVIKRINYFRRLVGLNDNCTLDTNYNSQEQQAALMMTANNSLNHNPPTTWLCYTTQGAAGAGSSNLALGSNSSQSVWDFISDFGSGNTAVGHRRWILHSTKQHFSYGSTSYAMALYVFHNDTNSHIPTFIAYPPKGYVPQQLIPARWSFGIPSADFSSATVVMSGSSGNVPLTIVSSTANGYGDNTLVWEPTGIDASNASDVIYTITVSGIQNAPQTSYTYTTTIIRP